jgi:hypothetical protein
MNQTDPIDVLNRLLKLLYRSLPVYLAEAWPWSARGGDDARILKLIAADQLRLAERVADAVFELGGRIDTGGFPAEFTSKHDLSLNFAMKLAAESLERDLDVVPQCISDLAAFPLLRSLAAEILGNTRGHLETLKEGMKDEG